MAISNMENIQNSQLQKYKENMGIFHNKMPFELMWKRMESFYNNNNIFLLTVYMYSPPLGNGESGCITTREVAAGNWLVISSDK